MDHWQMFAFFFVGSLFEEIRGISINVVNIPKAVREGTDEPIVLDCDYDMGSSSNIGLTIKWYLGNDLLYQWIFGNSPQASDEFDKYIDVSYRASDNPDTMYRAVKLVRPGRNLSGKYRCVVFTHDDEAEASGKMIVYSPEHDFRLQHLHMRDDDLHREIQVICKAEGIYPQPQMTLQQNTEVIDNQRQDCKVRADGRFNVEVTANMDTKTLELPVKLKCELYIQEANYTAFREYVYSGSSRLSCRFDSIVAGILVVLFVWSEK